MPGLRSLNLGEAAKLNFGKMGKMDVKTRK